MDHWLDTLPLHSARSAVLVNIRKFLQGFFEGQTYASSTEQIHSLHLLHAHEAGLLRSSVRVEISHTASPQAG
jgi:hypothetical protein